MYADATLADMYGKMFLFPELQKAHRANDAAVMAAYGFSPKLDETQVVARLFERYQKLTKR